MENRLFRDKCSFSSYLLSQILPSFMESFKTGVAHKSLTYKIRASSSLAQIKVILNIKYFNYSNKFAPETKLENCLLLLEKMSLHWSPLRYYMPFFFKRGKYIENKKLLLNLSDIIFFFFKIERILSKTFLKKATRAQKVHAQL